MPVGHALLLLNRKWALFHVRASRQDKRGAYPEDEADHGAQPEFARPPSADEDRHENQDGKDHDHGPFREIDETFKRLLVILDVHIAILVLGHGYCPCCGIRRSLRPIADLVRSVTGPKRRSGHVSQ
jgi:hypothetical protein